MSISRSNLLIAALTIVVVLACAGRSSLASVVVDESYFTGSKTTVGATGTGGGLKWNPADGDWSQGKFSISWEIVPKGSDFTYTYTISTPADGKARLSHWILELSPFDFAGDSLERYWEDVFVDLETGNYTDTGIGAVDVGLTGSGSGNPGMPNINNPADNKDDIFGVRFNRDEDLSTIVVTFTTPQVPVWGDFYAKNGGGSGTNAVWAYNAGFGTDPTTETTVFTNWIPRPDGQNTGGSTPEPATLIVWSLLIGSVALARLRRRPRNPG